MKTWGEPAFTFKTRILFIDTDASRRIHYTCMFRYFEAAEIEFFRTIGLRHNHPELAFPRVHAECDYRSAIRYDDEITIQVFLGRVGNASMKLVFRVMCQGQEAAAGNVVIACIDKATERTTPIPADLRDKLREFVRAEDQV